MKLKSDRPGAGVTAVVEGRVDQLAGVDEVRGLIGIGRLVDEVVVGQRGC
jgi:hypothetical protein